MLRSVRSVGSVDEMVFQTLKRWSSHGSHGSDDLKPDISEEELKKLYAKASTQKFVDNPRYAFHPTAGVIPMSITGRFANERERLGPDFDDTQRDWRTKWIRDQHIHPNEPFDVKQLYYEYHNPIRRFYRKPLDLLEAQLVSCLGTGREERGYAANIRKIIGRGALIYCGILGFWYYLKYNREHWEKEKGIRVYIHRENVYPGDRRFPRPDPRTESYQFFDRGFHDRKVLLNRD